MGATLPLLEGVFAVGWPEHDATSNIALAKAATLATRLKERIVILLIEIRVVVVPTGCYINTSTQNQTSLTFYKFISNFVHLG